MVGDPQLAMFGDPQLAKVEDPQLAMVGEPPHQPEKKWPKKKCSYHYLYRTYHLSTTSHE